MYFSGLLLAIGTFLVIGLFHPLVIKTEYYFGTRPWWIFLLLGICAIVASLLTSNLILSAFLGVVGASLLWSIGELFAQKKRVEKGWFPMNKKRAAEYHPLNHDDSICPLPNIKRKEDEDSMYLER